MSKLAAYALEDVPTEAIHDLNLVRKHWLGVVEQNSKVLEHLVDYASGKSESVNPESIEGPFTVLVPLANTEEGRSALEGWAQFFAMNIREIMELVRDAESNPQRSVVDIQRVARMTAELLDSAEYALE